jgi:hypothetical protein
MIEIELKPLFGTPNQQAVTLDQNLERIEGSLYCSENMITQDYVDALEQAVKIVDPDCRNAFVNLAASRRYQQQQRAAAHRSLVVVRKQLAHVVEHLRLTKTEQQP